MNTREFERISRMVDEALQSRSLNWQALEDSLSNPEEKEILRHLRQVREIAVFNTASGNEAVEETVRTKPPTHPGPSAPTDSPVPADRTGAQSEGPCGRAEDECEDGMGRTWGKLRLLRRLGGGAFGEVFLALDPDLDGQVALKLFRRTGGQRSLEESRATSPHARQMMVQEGRLMARVRDPNVAVIYGADEIDAEVGIWMDYIRGRTLHELVIEQGRFGPQEAILIGLDLCRALAAVHASGLVHGDVKAQNVMREEGGRIVLMDFGAGIRLPEAVDKVVDFPSGTPLYMAPETLLDGSASPVSDQYSLGVLLFFLVTGGYPVVAESLPELVQHHRDGERKLLRDVRTDLPLSFVEVVERSIERDSKARFASMREMERALNVALGALAARSASPSDFLSATRPPGSDGPAPVPIERAPRLHWVPKAIRASLHRPRAAAVLLAVACAIAIMILLRVARQHHPAVSPEFRQVTTTGLAFSATISPDGKFVAFVEETKAGPRCMVKDLAGGDPIPVASGYHIQGLAWSPDGTQLLLGMSQMGANECGTYLVPRLGGGPRKVADDRYIVDWLPDGNRFVGATIDSAGALSLDLVNAVSGKVAALNSKKTPGTARLVACSAQGDRIALVFRGQDESGSSLFTRSLQGDSMERIVQGDANQEVLAARWSPKGDALYYLLASGDISQLRKVHINPRTNKISSEPQTVLSGLKGVSDFTLSKDGRLLAYTQWAGNSHLWLVDRAEGVEGMSARLRRLTAGTQNQNWPDVSPDGTRVAFSQGTATYNVCIMPLPGGPITQLTFLQASCYYPQWSGDGTRLAFITEAEKRWRPAVMDVAGGLPHRFGGSEAIHAIWMADGRLLLQGSDMKKPLRILDPTTDTESPLAGQDSSCFKFDCRCSPDGRRLAFAGIARDSCGVFVSPMEGTGRRLIYDGTLLNQIRLIDWSSDGASVYALAIADSSFVIRIPASGGVAQRLFALQFEPRPSQVLSPGTLDASMTPDARRFVFALPEEQSDVWVVSHFDPEME